MLFLQAYSVWLQSAFPSVYIQNKENYVNRKPKADKYTLSAFFIAIQRSIGKQIITTKYDIKVN